MTTTQRLWRGPSIPDYGFGLILLAVLVCHIALLAILNIHIKSRPPRPEKVLRIDLLPARTLQPPPSSDEAIAKTDPATEPIARPQNQRPGDNDTMVRANRLFTAGVLAAERNEDARQMLQDTQIEDRIVQLCNTEAMEQVALARPDLKPDNVVAYARKEVVIDGPSVVAQGAALRSRGTWHDLRFKCVANAEDLSVSAFEYAIGKPIPARLWEQLSLPTN